MDFNPLSHLLNTRFTIIEIGLFYGGKHLEAKLCRILTLKLTRGQCLLNQQTSCLTDKWKHLKLKSFNPSLKYWTFFPKDCWWIHHFTKAIFSSPQSFVGTKNCKCWWWIKKTNVTEQHYFAPREAWNRQKFVLVKWRILKYGKRLKFHSQFKLFQLLTNFIECFAICSWKLSCSH